MAIEWEMFCIGAVGAVSIELLRIWTAFQRGQPPKRLKEVGFWVAWLSVAMLGGFLAGVVYKIQDEVVSFHIGVSMPLIVDAASRKREFA